MTDTFWEIDEVRKGLWAISPPLSLFRRWLAGQANARSYGTYPDVKGCIHHSLYAVLGDISNCSTETFW